MLTADYAFAWPAGKGDRRAFVLDVKDDRANDKTWFDPIYEGLENGGYEQLLYYLLNLELGAWHPRDRPITLELNEQKRMNAEPINAWLMDCAAAGEAVASPLSHYPVTPLPLGKPHHTNALYNRFTEWAKYHGVRRISTTPVFGKLIGKTLGEKRHHPNLVVDGKNNPGWTMPDANALARAVDEALGIRDIGHLRRRCTRFRSRQGRFPAHSSVVL
jgi:hypothetical protein